MIVEIPYGKGAVEVELPDDRVVSVLRAREARPVGDEPDDVRRALANPIGCSRIANLASDKDNVCILVSDYTRATPNRVLVPPIIEELKDAGLSMEKVSILVANGLHKPAPYSELRELLGEEVMEEVEVLNHDAEDEGSLTYLGRTRFGTELSVNKLVVESDLVIMTGLIEPHFFAGYSGGRKSILPGVAGRESIYQNHSFKMIDHPLSRSGILDGNPIHEDMVEAASLVKRNRKMAIVNVVIDKNHRILRTFCGDVFEAHRVGVNFLDGIFKVKAPAGADIVITSNGGYPLDRDLYQAVKGMATGELVVRDGGVIIIFSECMDGIGRGHELFYQLMAEAENPRQVLERIKREEPIKDQWEAQVLARILEKAKVIAVTENIRHSRLEEMHITPASSPEEALQLAREETGKDANMVVIPEGPYIIPSPS